MAQDVQLLIQMCLQGDQWSMGRLVQRYYGPVFGLCYRMLGDRQEAEDATQDTFLRVLRNLHRWDSRRSFEPWLLTIAGNRCRTRLASRVRRPNLFSLNHPVADSRSADIEQRQLREEIDLAVTRLRPEYRRAFDLFHRQQLSYEEIARQMDAPVGTVKTWVHRARREMAGRLAHRGIVS